MSRSWVGIATGLVTLAALTAGIGFLVGRESGRHAVSTTPVPPAEVGLPPPAKTDSEITEPSPAVPLPAGANVPKTPIPKSDIEKLNAAVEKDLEDLLSKSILEMEDEAVIEARNTAIQKGMSAPSKEESAKVWEDYLLQYPLGPGAVQMMSRLGGCYLSMGEYEEARKILRQAVELNGDDAFGGFLAINQALVELHAGDPEKAEAMLTAIAEREVPPDTADPQIIVPVVFTAPMKIASVYAMAGNLAKSEEVLEQTYNRGLDLLREHPEWNWVSSHIAGICQTRISLVLREEPADLDKARELVTTMEKDLGEITPTFSSPHYWIMRGDMDATFRSYLAKQEYAKKKKEEGRDEQTAP